MRGRHLTGVVIACVVALAGPLALAASAGPIEVPIPGLSGGVIQVAGALRTADGGGVIAARISTPGAQTGALTIARVQADGAVNLAYGTLGIAHVHASPVLEATALAVDPSGAAWIGVRFGADGPGEVIALDASGARVPTFGSEGVLRLPAADRGGPVALAVSDGRLLIAAGTAPCRGCSISVRDASTGRLLRRVTLSAATLAPARCAASVTGAALTAQSSVLLSTAVRGNRCAAQIVALAKTLTPPVNSSAPSLADTAARSSMLVPDGASWCLAATDTKHVNLLASGRGRWTSAAAPAGTLVALAQLGTGACAALIRTSRPGAVVAQMGAGNGRVSADTIPSSLTPLGMFRCNQHLLVIAGAAGDRTAVIVPVAVRRGPFATAASVASAQPQGTGCR